MRRIAEEEKNVALMVKMREVEGWEGGRWWTRAAGNESSDTALGELQVGDKSDLMNDYREL